MAFLRDQLLKTEEEFWQLVVQKEEQGLVFNLFRFIGEKDILLLV